MTLIQYCYLIENNYVGLTSRVSDTLKSGTIFTTMPSLLAQTSHQVQYKSIFCETTDTVIAEIPIIFNIMKVTNAHLSAALTILPPPTGQLKTHLGN